jgi:hypothetical protein
MTLRRKIIALALAVFGILAVVATTVAITVVVSGTSRSSLATTEPSDGDLFLFDTDLNLAKSGLSWRWKDDVYGSMSATDVNTEIICPMGSTGGFSFLSLAGAERTPNLWQASAPLGFNGQSTHILNANLTPGWLTNGNSLGARDVGGDFSLGVACSSDNGMKVTGAFYRSIAVVPGGSWTVVGLN